MKSIPTNELITMLQGAWPHEGVSKIAIDRIFEIYGDDYFLEDGEFKLTVENEERKQLFEKLKEYEQRESEEDKESKNTTNGDMIQTMFPYGTYGTNGNEIHVFGVGGNGCLVFTLDWWNAPYKVESEE